MCVYRLLGFLDVYFPTRAFLASFLNLKVPALGQRSGETLCLLYLPKPVDLHTQILSVVYPEPLHPLSWLPSRFTRQICQICIVTKIFYQYLPGGTTKISIPTPPPPL